MELKSKKGGVGKIIIWIVIILVIIAVIFVLYNSLSKEDVIDDNQQTLNQDTTNTEDSKPTQEQDKDQVTEEKPPRPPE